MSASPARAANATPRSWLILALGVLAQTSGTLVVSAPAFLIPFFHTQRGLSLAEAGLIAATPTLGMVLTLVAWGAAADRFGEKWVIVSGLVLAAAATLGALLNTGYVALGIFFLLGGMATASANAASGRVVIGWFPAHQRGLAMGIRQMSQPLGVTLAAVTVPVLAEAGGIELALVLPVALSAVLAVACAIGLLDPPRAAPAPAQPGVSANPYRRGPFLWQVHGVSLLLVVPQFTLSTFGLVWLITAQGLTAGAAGLVVGLAQFVGAVGRIGVGALSDRVASRMRPLRWVAVSTTVLMLALALIDQMHWGAAAVAFVIATLSSVAPNGLAFTAVAEYAGRGWAGRALGAQNTGQFIAASAVGPAVGALIGVAGYPIAFVAVALVSAVAIPLVPRRDAPDA